MTVSKGWPVSTVATPAAKPAAYSLAASAAPIAVLSLYFYRLLGIDIDSVTLTLIWPPIKEKQSKQICIYLFIYFSVSLPFCFFSFLVPLYRRHLPKCWGVLNEHTTWLSERHTLVKNYFFFNNKITLNPGLF